MTPPALRAYPRAMLRRPLLACAVLLLGCGASPTEAPADAARDVSPELDAPASVDARGAGEVGEEEAGRDAGPEEARDASPEASTDVTRDAGPELVDASPPDAAPPRDVVEEDAAPVDAPRDAPRDAPFCGFLVSCGGRCVDTRTDPNNCGDCGHVCAGRVCVDYFCP
jgi:hypothetical protein